MRILFVFMLVITLGSCVPAKKYNELLAKEKSCSEELNKYKTPALDNEANLKTALARLDLIEGEIKQLKEDTTNYGNQYRALKAKYKQAIGLSDAFEEELEKIKNSDAQHLARMKAELEGKIIETQRKEDELMAMERTLNEKQKLLAEKEERVRELEEMIAKQDAAVKALRDKIAKALLGFEGKGLTVVEKNGKIYVSLEAKLLFPSGSTVVDPTGKTAVIQLAKAVEGENDMEIVVEGHTDTDRLSSSVSPKNNWELSVLRATAVVEIMTANSDINPAILTAAGRSEFHPIDPNDKAKNRRIEVIIAPKLDALFELISK
ncbi:MAG: OmpA family protein [Brumimicrobium sp.]|nr:OmpA family protein [Brumimicrobium sp.]MCO5267690.1 OmpA family protein [Brumimicrobium sp.]